MKKTVQQKKNLDGPTAAKSETRVEKKDIASTENFYSEKDGFLIKNLSKNAPLLILY